MAVTPDDNSGGGNDASKANTVIQEHYQAKLMLIKKFVESAIRRKKIFTVLGPYPALKSSLHRRGWVEKLYCNPNKNAAKIIKQKNEEGSEESGDEDPFNYGIISQDQLLTEDKENIYTMMSQLVRHCAPTFIWTRRRDHINFRRLRHDQIVNHFPRAEFTTKIGLSRCMEDLHWFEDLDADNFFPRCYKIGLQHEKTAFIEDYRMTACMSILKWVVDSVQRGSVLILPTEDQFIVPSRTVETALIYCEIFLKTKKNEDIDKEDIPLLTDNDWSILLSWYFQLLSGKAILLQTQSYYESCILMLSRLRYHWPQIDMDGMHNIWIIKPGAKSRGVGIRILQNIEDILNLVNSKTHYQSYVVQKYIERPMLIHSTKFDIRQWFLVTDWNPLTIYFYRDCYLRFCSKAFTLHDRSEAAHLCNNAIQRYYIRRQKANVFPLPEECMWTSEEFKDYLRNAGKPNVWDSFIYPGMKNAVIATVQSAQNGIGVFRKNCFELYGADFMITDDYHPWLIEINSSPCMAPTTKVTAKLCANVLEDVCKVIIDRPRSKMCTTGRFECIYKQIPIPALQYIGISLKVQGVAIPKPSTLMTQPYKSHIKEADSSYLSSKNNSKAFQKPIRSSRKGKGIKESEKEQVNSLSTVDSSKPPSPVFVNEMGSSANLDVQETKAEEETAPSSLEIQEKAEDAAEENESTPVELQEKCCSSPETETNKKSALKGRKKQESKSDSKNSVKTSKTKMNAKIPANKKCDGEAAGENCVHTSEANDFAQTEIQNLQEQAKAVMEKPATTRSRFKLYKIQVADIERRIESLQTLLDVTTKIERSPIDANNQVKPSITVYGDVKRSDASLLPNEQNADFQAACDPVLDDETLRVLRRLKMICPASARLHSRLQSKTLVPKYHPQSREFLPPALLCRTRNQIPLVGEIVSHIPCCYCKQCTE